MTTSNAKYKGVTTEQGGRQNIYSIEPKIEVVDKVTTGNVLNYLMVVLQWSD